MASSSGGGARADDQKEDAEKSTAVTAATALPLGCSRGAVGLSPPCRAGHGADSSSEEDTAECEVATLPLGCCQGVADSRTAEQGFPAGSGAAGPSTGGLGKADLALEVFKVLAELSEEDATLDDFAEEDRVGLEKVFTDAQTELPSFADTPGEVATKPVPALLPELADMRRRG